MKKYAFLVHHSDYERFLEGLRKVGVLHVYAKNPDTPESVARLKLQYKEVNDIVQQLKKRNTEAIESRPVNHDLNGLGIVRTVLDLNAELERNRHQLLTLDKEISYLEPWGNFSPALLDQLYQEAGIETRLFVCPESKYDPTWQNRYNLEIIKTLPPDHYFVVFCSKDEVLEIAAEEWPVPKHSLDELREKKTALVNAIEQINHQLDQFAALRLPLLEKTLLEIEEEIAMAEAIGHTTHEAEDTVKLLEGFVPATKEKAILDFCEGEDVVFLYSKPRPADNPPVLLQNNAYSRLFEPIGKLFSLPSYAELDLTPFFAPFFMMFFGFCLGDAGYGLVVVLAATIYKPRAKPSLKPILSLIQWLGSATVIFGMLTGTFFGLSLLHDQFSWLGAVRNFMIDSHQAFQLALILGVIQILFGLGIKATNITRQNGFKYALTPIGWIILLVSLIDVSVTKLTGQVSTWTAWAGAGIILLFNDPDAGIFGRLGKGIWELYGITGFFGDLLSYIRLFALGTSGAILGFVINDISVRVLHGIPWLGPVLFVILLLVGHTANLLLSSLGSFVHPLRLTFVEFYKNAGFEGGGKAYKPLEKKT